MGLVRDRQAAEKVFLELRVRGITMSTLHIPRPNRRRHYLCRNRRKGSVLILSAILMVVMCAFLAFAVDLGFLYVAKNQLQNSADSAAMAGAWELLQERRLQGDVALADVMASARDQTVWYAAHNEVVKSPPVMVHNLGNSPDGDVVFGRLTSSGDFTTFGNESEYNSVLVRVSRTAERNGDVPLFFARVLGFESSGMTADAVATFRDGVRGFRPSPATGNPSLVPFSLHIDLWNALINGGGSDNWDYSVDTGELVVGSDNVREIQLFPNGTDGSGNFGTLEIGSPDNGTPDLARQIEYGLSADDLSYHDGALELDALTNTLQLAGDPGLSAGVKSAIEAIKGTPRTIALHDLVWSPGDNAQFRIVGFAGVRIVDYWLDGKNWREELLHYVTIQPAVVIDDSAITDNASGTSYFVHQRVTLSR
jgi:Flp pilus assembly protein TadG